MLRLLLLALLLVFFSKKSLYAQCPPANPVTVTNTNNVGGGSLNWAINCINTAPALTTIEFNITGATVISPTPAAPLPNITKANALVDGLTQPGVVIDGSLAGAGANGLNIVAGGGNVTIRGLHIRDFNGSAGGGAGIAVNQGNGCNLTDNRLTNNQIGIVTSSSISTFTIADNIIGLTASGGASGHIVHGIDIRGLPASGIIRDNTIAHSNASGINTVGGTVLISNNSMFCNLDDGITHPGGPAAPVITSANTQRIRGTAAVGSVIQVFSHSIAGCTAAPCQGRTLLGTVTTPAGGVWTLNLSTGQLPGGAQVTATSTQAANNTSIFANCATAADCSALIVNVNTTPVSCLGGSNGTATATVTGSSAPLFLWSNGFTGPTISGLVAGVYTVTVTDGATGCTATATGTVGQPAAALAATVSTTPVDCFGETTGSATAAATGGTTPHSFLWSNGQAAPTITNLAAGTYTVTVTDANGCTATATGTVGQPATALAASVSTTPVSCFGGNDGTATATASGGTTGAAGYTYLWSNGQTAQTITNLAAGTYTVTGTDANGCTATATGTVGQPAAALAATVSTTPADCFGETTGSATAAATGGTMPHSFLWSNGQAAPTITNLAAGTYTVTVTDANGCTATATGTVGQPAAALAASVSTTPVSCFGGNDGTATATASGGTTGAAGYTYLWSNGQTAQTITNLAAGTYTVTVTDANGCTATATGTVGQPATALAASVSTTPADCFGETTGSATAAATGGTTPHSFLWSNGQAAPTITNLAAGTYTVTVTDANGCTATATGTVGQPAAALAATVSTTPADCFGETTGSATAAATGGTMPHSFLWSNGQAAPTITNLAAGTYTVTVTDANGCTATATGTVGQPAAALAASVSTTPVSCFGGNDGTATATASGGTTGAAGYTYLWSNGQTAQTITNLAAGTYTVTVTDANGCTATATGTVGQPAAALAASVSTTPADCFGETTGSATAAATGGTTPHSFLWSNGQTAPTITNLAAGTYTVTVTDANGCTTTATGTVGQPPALSLSLNSTDETAVGANDGTATATAGGGTPTLTYLWSNAQTMPSIVGLAPGVYTITVTDANGCSISDFVSINAFQCAGLNLDVSSTNVTCFGAANGTATAVPSGSSGYTFLWNTGATTANIADLAPGNYTATVTDMAGCTAVDDASISQPPAINLSAVSTDVTCNGASNGTASASATGGTPSFSYTWNNGAAGQNLSGLMPGTYTVTATDVSGCTATASVSLSQPPTLSVSVGTTGVSCFNQNNGTASATAMGGTPGSSGYDYLWSNGQTAPTITNIAAGVYTVTVTDTNSCTATASASVGQPPLLSVGVSTTPVGCFGESTGGATATASGGTPSSGYGYLWSNGQTAPAIANLAVGIYTVTVTDAANCSATASGSVAQPPALSVSVNTMPVSCFGGNNGIATAAPMGGTPGYNYLWSNGQTAQTATNLPVGTFTVTVTDANGCTTTSSGSVGQPSVLSVSVGTTGVSCFGQNNGTASATTMGGMPGGGYGYLWSNGQTAQTAINLTAGTYTVTVTDLNGCTATATGTVGQPPALSLSLNSTDETAVGANDGTATATAGGGTPTLTYLWSNAQTMPSIVGLTPGVYTVTATDANGCSISDFVSINTFQCAGLNLNVTSISVTCFGLANGTATATASGSSGYTFLWNTGATTASIADLAPGNYTATVTDMAGCTAVDGTSISQPPVINLSAVSTDVTCNGASNGAASASATGGTPSFSYIWSNGTTGQSLSGLAPGTYTVTATDIAGCTASQTAGITEPPVLTLGISATDETAVGANDGTATAVPGGGTPPLNLLWSTGATAATITDLAPSTYTATVTDGNGCARSASATVAPFGCAGVSVGVSKTDVTCNSASNGAASASATGGTPSFSYIWSNGTTGQSLSGLAPGTYTVTATDVSGCTASQTASITEPPVLTLGISAIDETAVGANDGTATAVPGGGTPPLNLLWSTGATAATITDLAPGTYTATVTDGNGCARSASATVLAESGGCKPLPVFAALAPPQVCGNQPFVLEADDLFPHAAVRYVWYFPNGDSAVSAQTAVSVTPTSTAFSGKYFVLRDSAGCRSKSVGSIPVSVASLAPGTLRAGNDTLLCGIGTVTLKAAPPPLGIAATWASLGPAQVDNPVLAQTLVRNLVPGPNLFLWKADLPGCPAAAADTVAYFLEMPPLAHDDRYTLQGASDVAVMEVLLNDNLIGLADTVVYQVNSPLAGKLEYLAADRRFRFSVEAGYHGTVTFEYAVCPGAASTCGFVCDTATVTVEVLNLPKVPEGILLGDPGDNGRLLIDGIDLPEIRLEISVFNRWGDLVFSSKNYGAEEPWAGDFNGKKLPPGAYYYQIRVYESGEPLGGVLKGAVYLLEGGR